MPPPPRHLPNNPPPLLLLKLPNPRQDLEAALTQLLTRYPPKPHYRAAECHGLYNGPTSLAYLFLHLARWDPDLVIALAGENLRPLEWCHRYLAGTRPAAAAAAPSVVDADHCGVANETLARLAVRAAATGDEAGVERFLAVVREEGAGVGLLGTGAAGGSGSGSGSCEWLYGRAGMLYLLRMMRSFVDSVGAARLLSEAMREVVGTIVALRGQGLRGWRWHGKRYLGAAHGVVGIVTQCALSWDVGEGELERGPLGEALEQVLALQRPDGNWLPRSDSHDRGEGEALVQFCHGAPGFVVSLTALLERNCFPSLQLQLEAAVQRARKVVWQRGMLVKEPCLCHGISGNALALEEEQREHFLAYTTVEAVSKGQRERMFGESSDSWGLYGGLAGRVWGLLELAREREGRDRGGFIGYCDV
jgi:Lanthionine synthetase C-like protein